MVVTALSRGGLSLPIKTTRRLPSRPSLQLRHHDRRPHSWRCLAERSDDSNIKVDVTADTDVANETSTELDASYVPVLTLEELPKGERKEVVVDGKQIVVFWYRNELLACESRSPAEGAFSTGFLTANFTENYGIVCPGTDSVFSLKTGEIMDWYPSNLVLRSLIPKETCRKLEVYPVAVSGDTIYISFKGGNLGGMTSMKSKGGAGTSLEANNIFGLEPKMYVEGSTPEIPVEQSRGNTSGLNPVTVFTGTIAVAIVAVAGTAVAIYYESVVGLILFWIVMFGGAAFAITRILGIFEEKPTS